MGPTGNSLGLYPRFYNYGVSQYYGYFEVYGYASGSSTVRPSTHQWRHRNASCFSFFGLVLQRTRCRVYQRIFHWNDTLQPDPIFQRRCHLYGFKTASFDWEISPLVKIISTNDEFASPIAGRIKEPSQERIAKPIIYK